ncbi:hypothetical protein [Parasedimentitalea psychrophila]|uniref:Uncharacterized protein n=1 Tax=Parasedimentitalea psychrophila TaxID=2997337 RepID=A0A9Y2P5U2_9RHOB|nr:hypothetical protein [Parasedimentitalea psychrophila]WIY24318.1 hypothetical protein QPJ95_17200 [Parasedimentitalea psychrophila]
MKRLTPISESLKFKSQVQADVGYLEQQKREIAPQLSGEVKVHFYRMNE